MTDSRLQQLKRAWEASGSVEDEAAYLRERVRVGDLSQERLELAAIVGHRPALLVLGDQPVLDLEHGLSLLVEQVGPEYLLHVCLPFFRLYEELTRGRGEVSKATRLYDSATEALRTHSIGVWSDLSALSFDRSMGSPIEDLSIEGSFGSVFAIVSEQARDLCLLDPPYAAALVLLRRLEVEALECPQKGPEFEQLMGRVLDDSSMPSPWPTQPGDLEPFSF